MSTTSHWNPLHVFFVIVEGWEVWLPRESIHEAPCAESLIRCILRLWWGRVRTWTESIAPLLTQYVHHIPLEPTPCIFRHRWRLNHIERVHEAPCAEYDDGVFWLSEALVRIIPVWIIPVWIIPVWIIPVLNHTREVYDEYADPWSDVEKLYGWRDQVFRQQDPRAYSHEYY